MDAASTTPEGVFVHPRALCESEDVGAGTRIWAFAHVMSGARIGRHGNVGDHAFVEGGAVLGDRVTVKNAVLVWDGVTIEDDVFLGPACAFTNDLFPRSRDADWELAKTTVRRGATIGANVTVVAGVTIGVHATVGAGAVVIADVPDHALVVGSPARVIGHVCCCGRRMVLGSACERCGHHLAPDGAGVVACGDRPPS